MATEESQLPPAYTRRGQEPVLVAPGLVAPGNDQPPAYTEFFAPPVTQSPARPSRTFYFRLPSLFNAIPLNIYELPATAPVYTTTRSTRRLHTLHTLQVHRCYHPSDLTPPDPPRKQEVAEITFHRSSPVNEYAVNGRFFICRTISLGGGKFQCPIHASGAVLWCRYGSWGFGVVVTTSEGEEVGLYKALGKEKGELTIHGGWAEGTVLDEIIVGIIGVVEGMRRRGK